MTDQIDQLERTGRISIFWWWKSELAPGYKDKYKYKSQIRAWIVLTMKTFTGPHL